MDSDQVAGMIRGRDLATLLQQANRMRTPSTQCAAPAAPREGEGQGAGDEGQGQGASEDDSDAALVAAARRGEPKASFRIWEKYAPFVLRLVRGYFGPDADRGDLAQEVFLRVFSRLGELREPDALRGFIAGICLGVARNMSRRAHIRSVLRLSSHEDHREPSVSTTEGEARQTLRHLMGLLNAASAEDRSYFVARYVEKLEMSEVAQAHRVSIGTAKRRLASMTLRIEAAMAQDPVLTEYVGKLLRNGTGDR